MFYTVIEIQGLSNVSYSALTYHYDEISLALAKLYTVLAAASVSEIPYHSGHILRSDGIIIEGRVFDRREPIEE